MARLKGFEPLTVRLEGGCSIQLSYRRFNSLLFRGALLYGRKIIRQQNDLKKPRILG